MGYVQLCTEYYSASPLAKVDFCGLGIAHVVADSDSGDRLLDSARDSG